MPSQPCAFTAASASVTFSFSSFFPIFSPSFSPLPHSLCSSHFIFFLLFPFLSFFLVPLLLRSKSIFYPHGPRRELHPKPNPLHTINTSTDLRISARKFGSFIFVSKIAIMCCLYKREENTFPWWEKYWRFWSKLHSVENFDEGSCILARIFIANSELSWCGKNHKFSTQLTQSFGWVFVRNQDWTIRCAVV